MKVLLSQPTPWLLNFGTKEVIFLSWSEAVECPAHGHA